MDPIFDVHHKPTGCFSFKSVLQKPKTPLVLRKSKSSRGPAQTLPPVSFSPQPSPVRRRRQQAGASSQVEVLYHDFQPDGRQDRKSNSVVLPDVVATLSSEENIQEDQSQSQEKVFLEKLEEENLRLKAIFKLHSIKINARDEGERRRSSTDSARHSSVSSESSHEQTDCKEFEQKKMKNRTVKSRADNGSCTRVEVASASQERRGSRGIIKPSVARPVIVQDDDYHSDRVRYSNYQFYDTTARPGFVFLGQSGHVVAECHGHPTNSKIIVKTVRDEQTDQVTGAEEEFDEEKICAAQKLRLMSLRMEEERRAEN